jgi:hypothetical protein
VAVPLALVAIIFITPALVRPRQPQATDIPILLVEVTGHPWNGTVNETALLYVRSALGVPVYDYVAINVTGMGAAEGTNWTMNETHVPSLSLKLPVEDGVAVNVTAIAAKGEGTFRFNGTFEFAWDEAGWILRVQPEGATSPRDWEQFTVSVRLEEAP